MLGTAQKGTGGWAEFGTALGVTRMEHSSGRYRTGTTQQAQAQRHGTVDNEVRRYGFRYLGVVFFGMETPLEIRQGREPGQLGGAGCAADASTLIEKILKNRPKQGPVN